MQSTGGEGGHSAQWLRHHVGQQHHGSGCLDSVSVHLPILAFQSHTPWEAAGDASTWLATIHTQTQTEFLASGFSLARPHHRRHLGRLPAESRSVLLSASKSKEREKRIHVTGLNFDKYLNSICDFFSPNQNNNHLSQT